MDRAVDKDMPLTGHIAELRRLLILSLAALAAGSVVAYFMYPGIIDFLRRPFSIIAPDGEGNTLFINSILEGFVTRLKVSVIAGAVLSIPVHLYGGVRFVFPGLRPRERRVISAALAVSFLFIVSSFLYSYRTIIPVSVAFLTGKEFIPESTGILLGFTGNIFYILQFMAAALIVFQIPILLEVLLAVKAVRRKTLLGMGRFVVVGIFILAAVITPPDFITQLAIALPLSGLYFLTILVAKIFGLGGE